MYTDRDWLATQNEVGQTPKKYKLGGPYIRWMHSKQKRIVLFAIDGSIDDETLELYRGYCEAYFLGAEIAVVKPGAEIVVARSRDGKATRTKKIPADFLGTHKVANRMNNGILQFNASEINTALKEYRTSDTFCILGVTNQDLYPRPEWNFVYGQANTAAGTGIFSFTRHDVNFGQDPDEQSDYEPAEARAIWLKRSCSTMVHEIIHMFGIKHCIFYECTMNGSNGGFESGRVEGGTSLCPSCLIKL